MVIFEVLRAAIYCLVYFHFFWESSDLFLEQFPVKLRYTVQVKHLFKESFEELSKRHYLLLKGQISFSELFIRHIDSRETTVPVEHGPAPSYTRLVCKRYRAGASGPGRYRLYTL